MASFSMDVPIGIKVLARPSESVVLFVEAMLQQV